MRHTTPSISYKAIIFDMDGVVVDSEHVHMFAERITCIAHGVHVPDKFWKSCHGKMAAEIFTIIASSYAHHALTATDLISYKSQLFSNMSRTRLQAVPGALIFLARVRTYFARVGLATSSSRAMQQKLFSQLGIGECFDEITTADDVHKLKPDPEVYLHTALKLGVEPKDCLVIEDTPIGIRAARAAGCSTVGITTGCTPEELALAGADMVVRTYQELALRTKIVL